MSEPIFRVLIVDDNPPTANYIAELLHLFGFHALPVYSLGETLENLECFDFGLALVGSVPPPQCNEGYQDRLLEFMPECRVVPLDLQYTVGEIKLDGSAFDYLSLLFRAEEILNLVREAKSEHQQMT